MLSIVSHEHAQRSPENENTGASEGIESETGERRKNPISSPHTPRVRGWRARIHGFGASWNRAQSPIWVSLPEFQEKSKPFLFYFGFFFFSV